ncbi:MAG: hypothetical protein M3N21_05575 [Actinomycetota bacterium]|nr:hypothetical protein [Actinomycetota bacterium]
MMGKKFLASLALVGASIAGGAMGASLLGTANAATPSPGTTTTVPGAPGPGFHSNENAAHEAGESAAREAQENAMAAAGGSAGAVPPSTSASG